MGFFFKTKFGCDPIHPVSQTVSWAMKLEDQASIMAVSLNM